MNREQRPGISPSLGESMAYLTENLSDLQREYAGRWIALAGRRVRLSGDDLVSLQRAINGTCPNEPLLVDYIPVPDEILDWK